MNVVEPIRDFYKLEDILEYLKRTNPRNYIMFMVGIYTALRISDILRLKVKDVKNRNNITLREKKTGKQKIVPINLTLKKELEWYCKDKENYEYLIKSREQENKPITRDMAYKILRNLGDRFGVENLGTHTLRKTFGFHYYKQTKDIVVLQQCFNHSDPSITLAYIGIQQDTVNRAMRNFTFGK
ncbi:integrase [Acetoanaerobium pronyense]|uniref:Integrase n=1 Tax=Acetoanaerobium pronyense TaxID=1482736 RepID=A0ABS4KI10_9FIRM|nr:site-specific integrase [Acetoanaerobium pronyense]MBP2027418.1 integrase [Acetoanaerobium pronyense]